MEAHEKSSDDNDEKLCDEKMSLRTFLEIAELEQFYVVIREVLKINKTYQLVYVDKTDLLFIGMSTPEIRRYRSIYGKLFTISYMKKFKNFFNQLTGAKDDKIRRKKSPNPTEPLAFSDSVLVHRKHIIPIEDITINKELGMGQFGVVQQGTWNTGRQRLQVAIKCLGHERMTSNSTEFLKEAAVMHSIEHPNVVRLYGVVLHLDNIMLVTELAPLRSLLECLREVSLRCSFTVPTLCDFAEQICDGMTYLEEKRLIHRDLAARNILVFTKDKVKISDFGLSRALGVGKDYYQSNYNVNLKLPVAWCAPECILYLRFTSASDVWAFGVCLWEMFTYGFQPWAAFSGHQILEAIDVPNCQRLERPECCPASYYDAMMFCWEHEPADRPKFKELSQVLQKIRPELVQATANHVKPTDGRRGNLLQYKTGQIITVLNKEYMNSRMWYGVVAGGACGLFDPSQTKPYHRPAPFPKLRHNVPSVLSELPSRSSARSSRTSSPLLSRSDLKRHTYQGKRNLQRGTISSPQGDVKHTSHVGPDGAFFRDISFLDPAGCPPTQVTVPFKAEDEMEIPLLNSPSHSKAGRCKPPYPSNLNPDFHEVFLPYTGPLPFNSKYMQNPDSDDDTSPEDCAKTKTSFKMFSKNLDPTTSKSIISKMRNATLGRSKNGEGTSAAIDDDIHEYHEISDTDTDSPTNDYDAAALELPLDTQRSLYSVLTAPEVAKKGNFDFSESVLKEVDSVFWSYVDRGVDRGGAKQQQPGPATKSMTLGKMDKKRHPDTGTMKPMSAYDMKTLDTAVALANEITSKSMTDLNTTAKPGKSPVEKIKGLRNFKFSAVSLHHHDHGKDGGHGKSARRSFSEEAKNVQDIQATLSAESKHAYLCLIEEPTPPAELLRPTPPLMPKPKHISIPMRPHQPKPKFTVTAVKPRSSDDDDEPQQPINPLPLPPRANKPKLVDKPRHVRKYPLRMPAAEVVIRKERIIADEPTHCPIIYQNAAPRTKKFIHKIPRAQALAKLQKPKITELRECDETSSDTNPFMNPVPGPSSANPFDRYKQAALPDIDTESSEPSGEPYSEEEITVVVEHVNKKYYDEDSKEDSRERDPALTDHVSVEDLLDFANQKPCGRQRGIESDEVRVMVKVLKQEVKPEQCLQALELTDWNVHQAIKVMRVRIAIGDSVAVTLDECAAELAGHSDDVIKASTDLILSKAT